MWERDRNIRAVTNHLFGPNHQRLGFCGLGVSAIILQEEARLCPAMCIGTDQYTEFARNVANTSVNSTYVSSF
jgi:hypothetical protein